MFNRNARILFAAMLISDSLWVNAFSVRTETAAPATHKQDSHKPTKKRYLRQVDQQLKDLAARIVRLRARSRSLVRPARVRVAENIRMLEGKLHEARSLRNQVANAGAEWRDRKKELDAKMIRLQKSITYISNTMS